MAGSRDRERKLAREHHERQQVRRAARHQRQRLLSIVVGAVVLAGALVAAGVMVFGGSGKNASAAGKPTPAASSTPTPSATPTPPPVAEPAHHCVYTPSQQPAARKVSLPPTKPNWQAKYHATVVTNRGTVGIDLLNSEATCTVNSFVNLAKQKFYDNTPCPRVTTSGGLYVLQCGDPTGTGSGGPGYNFASENLTGATYPAGTVAMANSGSPDSNGSQFFLVYKNTSLPPSYTPFGRITSGLGILASVGKAGSDNSNPAGGGHPHEKVQIQRVTITKT